MSQNNADELAGRLKTYVPFLQEMIGSLKTDMPQHVKIVALHNIITDTRKKYKYDTLIKCEEVILKMQTKTNYKIRPSNPNHVTPTPASQKGQKFFPKVIPLSPVLPIPKDEIPNKSSISEESQTIRSPDPGTWEPPDHQADRYLSEVPSIYSKAAESVGKAKRVESILPELDTTKPPISLSDLELLKIDILNSLTEDEENRAENKKPDEPIKLPSKVSLVPAPIIKPRSKDKAEDGKTNLHSKSTTHSVNKSINISDAKGKRSKEEVSNKDKSHKHPSSDAAKKEIVVKDENTKFASFLSSIDDHLLVDKKKRRDSKEGTKKEDDRKKDTKKEDDRKKDTKKEDDRKKDTKKEDDRKKEAKPKESKSNNKVPETLKPSNIVKEEVKTKTVDNKSKTDLPMVEKEVFTRLADKYNPKPRKTTEKKIEESSPTPNVDTPKRDPRLTPVAKPSYEPAANSSFNYPPLHRPNEGFNEVPKIIPNYRNNDQRNNDQRINDQRINDQRINDQRINDQRINEQRINDQRINDQRINDQRINQNPILNNKNNQLHEDFRNIETLQDNFGNTSRPNHSYNNAPFNKFNSNNNYDNQRNHHNYNEGQPRFQQNFNSRIPQDGPRLSQNRFPMNNTSRSQFVERPRMQFNDHHRFSNNPANQRNAPNNFPSNNQNINHRPMHYSNNFQQNFQSTSPNFQSPNPTFSSPKFQSPSPTYSNQNFNDTPKTFNPFDVPNEYDLSAIPPIHYERNNQQYYNNPPKTYKTWKAEREMRDPRTSKDKTTNKFERSKSTGRDDNDRNSWKRNETRVSPENDKRSERCKSIDPRLRSRSPPHRRNTIDEERKLSPEIDTITSPLENLCNSRKEAEARVIQNFKIPKKLKPTENILTDIELTNNIKSKDAEVSKNKDKEDNKTSKNVEENIAPQNSKKDDSKVTKTDLKKSDSMKNQDKDNKKIISTKKSDGNSTIDLKQVDNKNNSVSTNSKNIEKLPQSESTDKEELKEIECKSQIDKDNKPKVDKTSKMDKEKLPKINETRIGIISDVKIVIEKCPEIDDMEENKLKKGNKKRTQKDIGKDDDDKVEIEEIKNIEETEPPNNENDNQSSSKKTETDKDLKVEVEEPIKSKPKTKKYVPKPKCKQNKPKREESDKDSQASTSQMEDGPPTLLLEENRDEDQDEKKMLREKNLLDLSKGVDRNDLVKILENLKGTSEMDDKVFGLFGMFVNFVKGGTSEASTSQQSSSSVNEDNDDAPPLLTSFEDHDEDNKDLKQNFRSTRSSRKIGEAPTLEDPIESVGERIKSRKRMKLNPLALKKPRRNELDKLHEDIKETLGDDVLTSRRACKLNKNDAEVKKNKKPTDVSNETLCKKGKSLRVILEKLTDFERPKRSSVVKEEIPKRKSIPRTSKMTGCYTEADDLPKLELEVPFEQEEEKETKVIEETVKKKTLKRKKCAWALGVIKKKKRTTKKDEGQVGDGDENEVEDQNEEGGTEENVVDSEIEDEEDLEYVTPNSDYYFLANAANKCELCDFKGKLIIQHYIFTHPRHEICVSKLPPNETKDAVEESERLNLDELEPFNEIFGSNRRKRFEFICRFCKHNLKDTAINFHDHLTQHTGELRFKCSSCKYKSQSKKNFTYHNQFVHKSEAELLIDPTPFNFRYVFGYVCSECNFLQLERKAIEDHIKIYHLGNNVRPVRINMSYPIEGTEEDVNNSKTINESAGEGTENTSAEIEDADEHTPPDNDKFNETTDEDDINVVDVPGVLNKKNPNEKKNSTVKSPSNATRNIKYKSAKTKVGRNKVDLETLEDIPDNTSEASENSELFENDVESIQQSPEISKKNKRPKRSTSWSPKKRKVLKVAKNDQIVEKKSKRRLDVNETKNSSSNSATKDQDNEVPDFTAFIGGKDIVDEELSLEQFRLGKMQEIEESLKNNKIISKRTSFVNELKTRLETETKEKSPEPTPPLLEPKIEPIDYMEEANEICKDDSEKLMESNVNLNVQIEIFKQTNEMSNETSKENKTPGQAPAMQTTLIQASDIKRESPPSPPPLVEYVPKENPVHNIVSRLQEQLNERLVPKVEVLDNGNKLYSVGAIDAQVSPSGLTIYYCRRTNCIFNTENKSVFESHCKLTHKYDLLILTCQVCVEKQTEKQEMLKIFNHLCKHVEEGLSKEAQDSSLEKEPETSSPMPPSMKIKISNVTSLATKKDNILPPLVPIGRNPEQKLILISASSAKTKVVSSNKPLILNQLLPTNLNQALSNIKKVQPPATMVTCKLAPITKDEVDIPRKHPDILKAWLHPIILQRLLKCPVFNCEFTTDGEEDFDSHIKFHDSNALLSCMYCNFKMRSEFIKVHYMMRHAKSFYGCPYCLYRSVSIDYIQIHQESKHKFKPIKALNFKVDQFSTVYRSPNPPHIKNIMKPYICSCQKKFYAIPIFEAHLSKCAETYKCSLCKTMFLKPQSLIQHFQMHQVFAYNCRYCAFGAQTPELILNHIAAEHPYQKVNIIWRHLKNGYSVKDSNEEGDSVFDNFIVISRSNGDEGLNTPSTSSINTEVIVLDDDDDQLEEITKVDIKTEKKDNETITESVKENPQIIMNKTGNHNDNMEEDSVDIIDYDESDQTIKSSLTGTELYKCYSCKGSFSDKHDFKAHLIICKFIDDKTKPYGCYHCHKWFKNTFCLLDHIRIHGAKKITCSLCSAKYAHPWHARSHMKTKHNINNCSLMAIGAKKTNPDLDEFVIKPYVRRSALEKLQQATEPVAIDESNKSGLKKSFSPEEINLLPVRPIFNQNVYCSICNFGTKVRTNLVRHMQLHKNNEDALIPVSCPVNPVPCLEKNEMMFDKMTNLANSSYSRMGGRDPLKSKDDEIYSDVPAHIPSNKRYVCGANNCNYLCLEESMLRHHLQALHWHESVYVCSHCQENLCLAKFTLNIDEIINHIRLHEGTLYSCGYCKFFHNLRNKIEKHSSDKHADKAVKIRTIREENENGDNEREKRHKPWRCGMCKGRYASKCEAKTHVQSKHGLDFQYKCNYCNFSGSDKNNYTAHYNSHHNGLVDDVVVTYWHEEEKEKEKDKKVTELAEESFDTTPLWVKNKNNVKHIRGILIEEQEKVSKRSPIKMGPIIPERKNSINDRRLEKKGTHMDKKGLEFTKKNLINTNADKLIERRNQLDISLLNETRTNKPNPNKSFSNLDFCIDAVATGNEVCASLKSVEVPTRRGRKRKNDEQQLQNFEFVNIAVNDESPPILFKAEPQQTDSVVDVDDTSHINTTKIIEPGTTIHNPTKSDLESMTIDKLINNSFMGLYGPFGKPHESLFQCPLCDLYQTKELMVFEIHLMEELDYKRYSCDICQFNSVTYAQMRTHYNETHGSIQPDNISSILRDEQIDNWIQNVILLQNRLIINFNKNENDVDDTTAKFFNRSNDVSSTKNDEGESSSTTGKNNEEISEMDISMYGCTLCNFKAKYQSNLKEHMVRRHSYKKPFQCPYCSYSSVRKADCMKHVRNLHKTKPDRVICNKDETLISPKSKVNPDSLNYTIEHVDSSKMKSTARKSTSAGNRLQKQTARKSTCAPRKPETPPYSYYGSAPDITKDELSKITTTIPIMDKSVTVTIAQLQKFFNIFPKVSIEDIEKSQL